MRKARPQLRHELGIDPKRLPELVDRLYRAARAISGSTQDADDLVQETFVRVFARPRAFRNDDPTPYLLRTLRNTYLTGIRTAGRRPRTSQLPAEGSPAMHSQVAQPEVELEQREAFEMIAALGPDFRDALVAVDIVGLSYREAAAALGTQEATIATRLFRARQTVARSLSTPSDARRACCAEKDPLAGSVCSM